MHVLLRQGAAATDVAGSPHMDRLIQARSPGVCRVSVAMRVAIHVTPRAAMESRPRSKCWVLYAPMYFRETGTGSSGPRPRPVRRAQRPSAEPGPPPGTPAAPSRRNLPTAPLRSAARCPFCRLLPRQPCCCASGQGARVGASYGAQSRLHGSCRICFTVIYRTHAFPAAPPLHFARISCLQPLTLQCIALPCCAQGILVLARWFFACPMLSSLHAGAAGRLSAQARTESIGAAGARGACAIDSPALLKILASL